MCKTAILTVGRLTQSTIAWKTTDMSTETLQFCPKQTPSLCSRSLVEGHSHQGLAKAKSLCVAGPCRRSLSSMPAQKTGCKSTCYMHLYAQGIFNVLCPPPSSRNYAHYPVISKPPWHLTWSKYFNFQVYEPVFSNVHVSKYVSIFRLPSSQNFPTAFKFVQSKWYKV